MRQNGARNGCEGNPKGTWESKAAGERERAELGARGRLHSLSARGLEQGVRHAEAIHRELAEFEAARATADSVHAMAAPVLVLFDRAVRAAGRIERLGSRQDLVDDLDDRALALAARIPGIPAHEWRRRAVRDARLRAAGDCRADPEIELGGVDSGSAPSAELLPAVSPCGVAGGQGRSPEELEAAALGSMVLIVWAFGAACVVAVAAAVWGLIR